MWALKAFALGAGAAVAVGAAYYAAFWIGMDKHGAYFMSGYVLAEAMRAARAAMTATTTPSEERGEQ